MIGTGSMSDPYMHCEEELKLTRKCLEVVYRNGFGITLLMKSDRILRDVCREHNILYKPDDCFRYLNEFPEKNEQLTLF